MILATWYKENLKSSLLSKIYVNQNKTQGVDVKDKDHAQKIYNKYVEAFKNGVYDYIQEDYDPASQQIVPRKYFSGGAAFQEVAVRDDQARGEEVWEITQERKHLQLMVGIKSDNEEVNQVFNQDVDWVEEELADASMLGNVDVPQEMIAILEAIYREEHPDGKPSSLLKGQSIEAFMKRYRNYPKRTLIGVLKQVTYALDEAELEVDRKKTADLVAFLDFSRSIAMEMSKLFEMMFIELMKTGDIELIYQMFKAANDQFMSANPAIRSFSKSYYRSLVALTYRNPVAMLREFMKQGGSFGDSSYYTVDVIVEFLEFLQSINSVQFANDQLKRYLEDTLDGLSLQEEWTSVEDSDQSLLLELIIKQLFRREGHDMLTLNAARGSIYIRKSDRHLYFVKQYEPAFSAEEIEEIEVAEESEEPEQFEFFVYFQLRELI